MSGVVVWLTGLPSSGKSTLAERVAATLRAQGRHDVCVLDGDAVRAAVVPRWGYDDTSRDRFYDSLAALAALLASQGLVVLVPATAHHEAYRERARARAPRFVEVYVRTDDAVVKARDAKGLYAAQREGATTQLPGADVVYDVPTRPDVVAEGGHDDEALARVVALVVSSTAP